MPIPPNVLLLRISLQTWGIRAYKSRLSKFRILQIPSQYRLTQPVKTFERILEFVAYFEFSWSILCSLLFHYADWILIFSAPIALKNWHDRQTTTDAKDTLIITHHDLLSFFLIYICLLISRSSLAYYPLGLKNWPAGSVICSRWTWLRLNRMDEKLNNAYWIPLCFAINFLSLHGSKQLIEEWNK